jgi:hypothetical protein
VQTLLDTLAALALLRYMWRKKMYTLPSDQHNVSQFVCYLHCIAA